MMFEAPQPTLPLSVLLFSAVCAKFLQRPALDCDHCRNDNLFCRGTSYSLASGFAITALSMFSALFYVITYTRNVLHQTHYHSESEASCFHLRNSGCHASKEHQTRRCHISLSHAIASYVLSYLHFM